MIILRITRALQRSMAAPGNRLRNCAGNRSAHRAGTAARCGQHAFADVPEAGSAPPAAARLEWAIVIFPSKVYTEYMY